MLSVHKTTLPVFHADKCPRKVIISEKAYLFSLVGIINN